MLLNLGVKRKKNGSLGRKDKKNKPVPSIWIMDSAPNIPKKTPPPPSKSKKVASTEELVDSKDGPILVAEKESLRTRCVSHLSFVWLHLWCTDFFYIC